jgi:hypothetical protein
MNKAEKQTAKKILRATGSFRNGCIEIKENNDFIDVISIVKDGESSGFFSLELVHMFPMFVSFMSYDEQRKKVIWRIC